MMDLKNCETRVTIWLVRDCKSFFQSLWNVPDITLPQGKGKQLKTLTNTCCSSETVHSGMLSGQCIMKLKLVHFNSEIQEDM